MWFSFSKAVVYPRHIFKLTPCLKHLLKSVAYLRMPNNRLVDNVVLVPPPHEADLIKL